MWSTVVLLTPCPWESWLTSLLTMIDQLTCYSSYDVPCDHLPNIKIESCHSLPVNYGTWLLITKGSITHKLLSWDNISDLCLFNVTYPLISISSDQATNNMVTVTNLCFTQLSIGHLKHDLSCFHGKALECYLPPDEDLQVSIIPYEGHLPSCPPIAS